MQWEGRNHRDALMGSTHQVTTVITITMKKSLCRCPLALKITTSSRLIYSKDNSTTCTTSQQSRSNTTTTAETSHIRPQGALATQICMRGRERNTLNRLAALQPFSLTTWQLKTQMIPSEIPSMMVRIGSNCWELRIRLRRHMMN